MKRHLVKNWSIANELAYLLELDGFDAETADSPKGPVVRTNAPDGVVKQLTAEAMREVSGRGNNYQGE